MIYGGIQPFRPPAMVRGWGMPGGLGGCGPALPHEEEDGALPVGEVPGLPEVREGALGPHGPAQRSVAASPPLPEELEENGRCSCS